MKDGRQVIYFSCVMVTGLFFASAMSEMIKWFRFIHYRALFCFIYCLMWSLTLNNFLHRRLHLESNSLLLRRYFVPQINCHNYFESNRSITKVISFFYVFENWDTILTQFAILVTFFKIRNDKGAKNVSAYTRKVIYSSLSFQLTITVRWYHPVAQLSD